jgi:thymidylate synthase
MSGGMGKAVLSAAAMLLASTAGVFYWRSMITAPQEYTQRRILAKDSYKELTIEIRKVFTDKYWPEQKKSREERRKCHPESAEYQTCVLNFQKTIKKLIEESTIEVLKKYRIAKEIFEESVNFYDSDEELKEYGENIVKPNNQELPPTKLSMSDTNKILQYFANKLREKNSDCLDFDEYLVITSQIEDEIYKAYRIEIEEVNNAFEKYKDHLEDVVESMKQQTSSILASTDTSF